MELEREVTGVHDMYFTWTGNVEFDYWEMLTDMDGIPCVDADSNTETTVYTLDGRRLQNTDNLPRGIYIVNGSKILISQ